MKLALVCPELSGHLNPMLTLGRELARRGHTVTVVGNRDAEPSTVAAGLGFHAVGEAEHSSGQIQACKDRLAQLRGLAALKFTAEMLKDSIIVGLRDYPDALRTLAVDGVVVDQVTPAGGCVADQLRLPWVMVCNALAMHQEPAVPPATLGWRYRTGRLARLRNGLGNLILRTATRGMSDVIVRCRRQHGLPIESGNDWSHGLVQIAQQPAFFDFPRERLPDNFHYTGPWHGPTRDTDVPFPWETLSADRPLVYASLGTLQNRLRRTFTAILEACARLPVQVVLALGRRDAAWDGSVPANARVVPFVPQLAVLDRADVVVTHAGLNTTLEALARGKPLVCLPVTNDQPGVAERVRWLGAGEVVPPGRATAALLAEVIDRVRTVPSYRGAAVACQKRIAAGPGVVTAAELIERAIGNNERVVRTATS